ncbi:RNA-guided endonuclease IscB [Rhabdochromatium marinum]|uniref:RNA-guided endonuclease IscB n=1 Tax=Rhabdochromatium marinum TaxID=48729 RepID=UPI001907A4BB|nr:RNA-guided endonuclease IscB [Rhabdochromatium marinum]MBK1650174.1 HNH endonuclease [Rhabdochromatium marinum]
MTSNLVFVLDANRNVLDPCHPARARELLSKGKAAVLRRYPFTIILKRAVTDAQPKACQVKIDPGSKTTGIAVVQEDRVIWGAELAHRGGVIKKKLAVRRACRRNRRNRLGYRPARFLNRTKPPGWLAPSLQHRVQTTMTWVNRLSKFCNVGELVQELVRFDTQQMQHPEVSSVEYQHGELAGYEVREYLLEKWGRQCAYCGAKNVPLQIEHIHPKSRGGSDRVSNLTLACQQCNQKKGNRPVEAFLNKKPDVLKRIQAQAKTPLKDAAAVNATRWALFHTLSATGVTVTVGTGGQTKYNRKQLGWGKAHWLDAAAVGDVGALRLLTEQPLTITAKGQGGRQKAALNRYGYPIRHNALKPIHGWRSGDIAVFDGKSYRVTPRTTGHFALSSPGQKPISKHQKHLKRAHRADGYAYAFCEDSITFLAKKGTI